MIVRVKKTQNLPRDLVHKIRIGFITGKQLNVPFEAGAHGLEAPDLELRQLGALDQLLASLEAVSTVNRVVREIGRQTCAEKHNQRLPRPGSPTTEL